VAGLGIHPDEPARLLDDPVHRRQTQPRPFAGRFRGEERLEDVRLRAGVHSSTRVRHGEHDVAAGLGGRVGLQVSLVHVHVGRFDGQPATSGHRVARVDRQVHDDLLELAGVDDRHAQIGSEESGELNVLSD